MTNTTLTGKTKARLKAELFLWNGWFGFYSHGETTRIHPQSNRQLPDECVADCSGAGCGTKAVSYWVDRLGFDGPAWLFRSHLKKYGAWDASDLADHNANRERVLWIWACDCAQFPGERDYLWLGI